ncbi:MAG: sensor histidine kinase [Planctomycetota bacterium]
MVAVAQAAGGRCDEPPLRPIAEVIALPVADLAAGVPARVRGIVVSKRMGMALQDGGVGIWVRGGEGVGEPRDPEAQRSAQVGDMVEVWGTVHRGGFAPTIEAKRLRILGTAPLPKPVPADLGRLFGGADNGIRVILGDRDEAIVQGYRETPETWRLVIDVAARRIVVQVPKHDMPERPDRLVDAQVSVVGVVGATRNSRGQFLAPHLTVVAADDITVRVPAPSSPFESPRVPLAEIAAFRPAPLARHRIQTEGIVTCHVPGRYCYVQDGLVGTRVDTVTTEPLQPGDAVRIAGFVDIGRTIAGIVEGIVERTGHPGVPVPVDVTPEEIGRILAKSRTEGSVAEPTNYAGVLVRFPATLVERQRLQDGWMLTLAHGESSTVARLPVVTPADDSALGRLRPGSDLEVTGIVRLDSELPTDFLASGANPDIRPVELVLRSAADVRVVRAPSWWTPRRLAAALAGVAGLLAAVLGWVWSLRRELAVQVDRVAHEIRSRREAEVVFEATLRERNRLAANLHDTLLQTLGGIRFQLDACRVAGRTADDRDDDDDADAADEVGAREHFDVARRMIDHAAQEVRGSVWALRTAPMPGRSFTESVAAVIGQCEKQLPRARGVRISLQSSGVVEELPTFVAGNLLLVVQEAIRNAIRHAAPTTIEVAAEAAADGSLTITVRDDGAGFELGTAAGPAQGHFGLVGMRERVERLGGTLEIESSPGAGTTITAHVRQPAAIAQAEPVG